MRIQIAAFVLCLSGCAVVPKPPEVKIPDAAILIQKVRIDPKLLVDCDPSLAELKGLQPQDVLQAFAESQAIHAQCYQRNHELIGVVKTAFPQEVPNAATSASSPQPK